MVQACDIPIQFAFKRFKIAATYECDADPRPKAAKSPLVAARLFSDRPIPKEKSYSVEFQIASKKEISRVVEGIEIEEGQREIVSLAEEDETAFGEGNGGQPELQSLEVSWLSKELSLWISSISLVTDHLTRYNRAVMAPTRCRDTRGTFQVHRCRGRINGELHIGDGWMMLRKVANM